MDKFQSHIIEVIKKNTKLKEFNLEVPPDQKLGDYAFPCFILAKELKKSPMEIAKDLSVKIKPDSIISEVKAVGPYLNLFVNKEKLSKDILKRIIEGKDGFGKQKSTNKKIIIEYPGPNTNKPLHLGHVRNMVLGTALKNILEVNGNNVHHVNVNNDRGVHICKSMLAYKKFGKNDSPEKSKMKSDFFVGKYYVKFAEEAKKNPLLEEEALEMVKKWESNDKETIELWEKMNKWAFDGFKETYKTFDIKPEKEYFESGTYKEGKAIILEGLKKGIFFKDEKGNIAVDLTKQGFDKKVLLRADGTTVYITQDIYLAKAKYDDFKFDKSIYVVATEQNYHFNVLFEVLKILKFPFAEKCHHFAYGMVNLTTGKMKSREGTVVDADNLVDEMKEMASKETKSRHKELSEKEIGRRAEKIALAAIRFYLLKYDPIKDITFDPKESISFEGETGPYIQYTYARINSILKKSKNKINDAVDVSCLENDEEIKIITLLSQFEEIVKDSAEKYKTNYIPRYLLDLAQAFNNFYHVHPVLKADENIKEARIIMILCVKQVIKKGLSLLGIDVLEEM